MVTRYLLHRRGRDGLGERPRHIVKVRERMTHGRRSLIDGIVGAWKAVPLILRNI